MVLGVDDPTLSLADNQGSVGSVRNESLNCRTKHIDVRSHYTRNALREKQAKLDYRFTEEMKADVMT